MRTRADGPSLTVVHIGLMTPERYQRISEIFHKALELSPEERKAFLEIACANDVSLRREVDAVLNANDKSTGFMDAPAYQAAADLLVADKPQLQPGQRFGAYRIVSFVNRGGMGEVYLAHDPRLGRKVALKILPQEVAGDKARMLRFVREAKAAASINHPNIAHVYEVGQHEAYHFIAMEFIDGQTLRECINEGNTELAKLLRYLQQVAEALSKTHAAAIVHRDLKPDNIMISRDGYAKILDFGLAKLVGPGSHFVSASDLSAMATAIPSETSVQGTIMGTINYMSPEQAQGRVNDIDHRSDIFSFGCILFEAATHRRAFEGNDALDSLHRIVHSEIPNINELNPTSPPELQRILRRCLAKDPNKRYQSIKDVALELDDVCRDLESEPTIHRSLPMESQTHDTNLEKPRGSAFSSGTRLVLATVFAAVVISLAGIVYVRFFHSKGATTTRNSIVVLPLVNANNDLNIEYLSDGISEALINSLTELRQLKVIARSTAFRYKGKDVDPQQVGRELNVDTVLMGRVKQLGDNLDVQVDLVDANTGAQLWGKEYERNVSDVLSVKQAIAREVTDSLRLKLSGDERQQLSKRDTNNAESFQCYLRGRYYWNKRSADGLKKAIEQFQQAIDADPNFALGYVGLADSYLQLEQYTGVPASEVVPKARAAVDRALQLDDSLSEAHATSATINQKLWRWDEAEQELKRAISLNPNYPSAHHWYAYNLYIKRQFDDAFREIKLAHDLDPLSAVISENVAMASLLRGDVNSAVEQGRKTIALDPGFADAHYVLGFAYLKQGRNEDAGAEFQKSVDLSNRSGTYLGNLGYYYAVVGKRAEALAILKELEDKYAKGQASGLSLAGVYAGLGDKDQTFSWLEKDFQQRSGQLPTVAWRLHFEKIRNDPRYRDLLARMGLGA